MSNKHSNKPQKDSLEEFFFQNKDEFESYEPSPELWLKINNKSGQGKDKVWYLNKNILTHPFLRLAAVFLAGIFAGWLVFDKGENTDEFQANETKKDTSVTIQYNVSLDDLSKDLGEVEHFYQTKINERIKELEILKVDKSMYEEVSFLDAEYKFLQSEVKDNLDKEKIVEAMIENLRFRLTMLENILKEVSAKRIGKSGKRTKPKKEVSL